MGGSPVNLPAMLHVAADDRVAVQPVDGQHDENAKYGTMMAQSNGIR